MLERILSIIFLGVVISGCGAFSPEGAINYHFNKGKHGLSMPEMDWMSGLPQGDDEYSQGFRDGCNTSLGIGAVGMMRLHGFAYDVNRGIENRHYYKGYRMGSDYCMYYMDVEPL